MGRSLTSIGLAVIFAAVFFAGWIAGPLVPAARAVPPESGASGVSAVDQHGEAHRWAPPFDGPTVIDFAASWCAPCRHSLPRLERFARDHPDVNVLVVSVDETRGGADELVASLDLRVPVLWDRGHEIASHYRPPAMPTTFLVDAEGRVLHAAEGSSEAAWKGLVSAVRKVESGAGSRSAD